MNAKARRRAEVQRLKKMEEELEAEEDAIAAARAVRIKAEQKEATLVAEARAKRAAAEAVRRRAAAREAAALAASDTAGIPVAEYKALYGIFSENHGDKWKAKTKWFDGRSRAEEWDRLEVEDGRVTKLMLSGNNMQGEIPWRCIAAFSELKVLCLNGNHLSGGVDAAALENLPKLETLLLHNNFLSGRIPVEVLCGLTHLQRLCLYESPGPLNHHIDNNSWELPPDRIEKKDLDCFCRDNILRIATTAHWPEELEEVE